MQHRQYFLMLGHAPGYFWVDFFVRESKCFMVEQNLILFYPWYYYATREYLGMCLHRQHRLNSGSSVCF